VRDTYIIKTVEPGYEVAVFNKYFR